MEEYTFTAKDFEVSLYVRLHNFLAGFFSRKDLLKEFCTKNAIDYKPIKDKKYKLPDSYLIDHGELEYLAGVRDKIILSFYEHYKKYQDSNYQETKRLAAEIDNLKDIIEDYKNKLTARKKQLAATKEPLERIHLQDAIGGLETSILNDKNNLATLDSELEKHRNLIKSNLKSWEKQVDIINNIFSIRKEVFNRNIGRKVVKRLNFTKFYSKYQDYSESVKQILKGEFNEKQDIK